MRLKKAIERLTLHESTERTLTNLFKDLNNALQNDDKDFFRKVKNSILMITNNESDYDIVIVDIVSGSFTREVVAYPKTSEARKFKFIY